jgi:hypothetical protein
MRHVVTGIGRDGRSTIITDEEKVLGTSKEAGLGVNDGELRSTDDSGVGVKRLWSTTGAPPACERPATDPLLALPLAPGDTIWMDLRFGPDTDYEFHRTDSIDFNWITGGEVELILEDASVLLQPGDSAVIPGVLHRWRSAPGWTATIFMVGLAPVGEP